MTTTEIAPTLADLSTDELDAMTDYLLTLR